MPTDRYNTANFGFFYNGLKAVDYLRNLHDEDHIVDALTYTKRCCEPEGHTLDELKQFSNDIYWLNEAKERGDIDDEFIKWMQTSRLSDMVADQGYAEKYAERTNIADNLDILDDLYYIVQYPPNYQFRLLYSLEQYPHTPITEIADRIGFRRKDDENEDT